MEPCIEQSSRMNSGYGFHCQRGTRLQDWAKAKKEKEKEKEKKGGEKKARQLDPVLRFCVFVVCALSGLLCAPYCRPVTGTVVKRVSGCRRFCTILIPTSRK